MKRKFSVSATHIADLLFDPQQLFDRLSGRPRPVTENVRRGIAVHAKRYRHNRARISGAEKENQEKVS